MKLHYQTNGQGQPLLLLHGLFGAGNNWGTIAKHFAQQFQVISVDLRNHGNSPHSDKHTYPLMAADIAELCDALHLGSIHLVGHSMGGKVAMQFAAQYPELIDNLVVVDMAMRAYDDAHTHLMQAMLDVDLTTLRSRSEVDAALSKAIPDVQVRQFLLMNLIKSGEQLTWRIPLKALKANYPAMQQAVFETALYAKPCLFIRGAHSDYVQTSDMAELKAHFPAAEFADLPTGHWVHAEQPQAFIEVLERFLKQ